MKNIDWTSEYYETVTFYYWEPQHLGRSKSAKCRYNNVRDMLAHVKKMEVSLNHMFNLFFRLAPDSMISEIMSSLCEEPFNEELELLDREIVEGFCQLVQPDLMFQGEHVNLSIEMKIGAKSNLEQVWKYALLHWLADNSDQIERESILVYLGKTKFSSLWREAIDTPAAAIRIASDWDASVLYRRAVHTEKVQINWNQVTETLQRTRIFFFSYSDFRSILKAKLEGLGEFNGPAESLFKLVKGLCSELERRNLIIS